MNSVELLGHYGGDETHALSAWTSTKRELTEERATRLDKMLTMLAENGHHTPFEKSYLHFLITCDTATHIQILKHRIGVNVNGESARYKEFKEDKWHLPTDWPSKELDILNKYVNDGFALYHRAIEELQKAGLSRARAKESARFFLPYATQLKLDVGFNFRSFMHFQRLRNSRHAQKEIRELSIQMVELVRETGDFNKSLEAFGF